MRASRPLGSVLAASVLAAACGGGGGGGGGGGPAQGDGTFSTTAVPALPVPGPLNDIVSADFDDDGVPDLAATSYTENGVRVWLGIGDGTFSEHPSGPFATGADPNFMAVADFDEDGALDLAVSCFEPAQASILLGGGDGTFAAGTPVPAPGRYTAGIATGDFDEDGNADLLLAHVTIGGVHRIAVFLGDGDGEFVAAPVPTVDVLATPRGITVTDLNGDGNQDFAATNFEGAAVSLFLGGGDGTFALAEHEPVSADPFTTVIGRFDGDAIPDLAAPSDSLSGASIRLGNGDGTMRDAVPPRVPSSGDLSFALATGDFDADGSLDLLVGNYDVASLSVLLGRGDGTFVPGPQPLIDVGIAPQALWVADFDDDGVLDVALAGGGTQVTILMGNRR